MSCVSVCLCVCVLCVQAFNDDGYDVVKNVTYGGRRGFTAASRNVTVLSTGAHKVVHYVEGDAYSMGYLAGLLTETGASAMVTTYIDHFIVSLISFKLGKLYAILGLCLFLSVIVCLNFSVSLSLALCLSLCLSV